MYVLNLLSVRKLKRSFLKMVRSNSIFVTRAIKAFINSNTEKNNNLGKTSNTFDCQREKETVLQPLLKPEWITILDSVFLAYVGYNQWLFNQKKKEKIRPSDYSALYLIHE